MQFKLGFSEEAKLKLKELKEDNSKKGLLKQVRRILGFMETNLKHPSLNTHKFDDLKIPRIPVTIGSSKHKGLRTIIKKVIKTSLNHDHL